MNMRLPHDQHTTRRLVQADETASRNTGNAKEAMPYNSTSFRHARRYLLPRTIAEAEAYLRHRRETAHLMAAHHKYFPDEFSDRWKQDALLPEHENTYSEAELHCLRLIDARLFPFAFDHLLLCLDEDEQRLPIIPLWSFGIDRWNRPWSDFEPGWQMLLFLVNEVNEVGDDKQSRYIRAILAEARHAVVSLERMDELSRVEEVPLRYLPTALRMIDHSTDNAFLDPTDDMPCEDMCWDLDDIEFLKEHWIEAQMMIEQADKLVAWLAADPQHLRKVVELWNRSQNTTP